MKRINKIKNIVRKIGARFITFFIGLLFIESMFKIYAFSNLFDIEYIRIILFTITTSLVFTLISFLINEKIGNIIVLILFFLISIYTVAQLGFKNFLGNYMSINIAGDGAGRVTDQVYDFISYIKLEYYIILLPFIILLLITIFKKKDRRIVRAPLISNIFLLLLIVIFHSLSLLTLENNTFQLENQIVTNKSLYKRPVLQELALKQFGVTRFLVRDIIYMVSPKNTEHDDIVIKTLEKKNKPVEISYERKIDDEEWLNLIKSEKDGTLNLLNNFFISEPITDKNIMTGKFKDKNLIYIMIEAFDMIAINEELTPTLFKLANEGWYFDNYYTPIYSHPTGETEFIGLTSLVPVSYGCTPNIYMDNDYETAIFNLFNGSGYFSSSYHNYSDRFYNRTTIHKNMGSAKFYNDDDLEIEKLSGWPSDLNLMEEALPHFINKDKFFSFIITCSTHFPYDSDSTLRRKHWDKVKHLDYPNKIKTYLAKMIELDLGLEYLIEQLDENNILDDTVIVVFSDHHPVHTEEAYIDQASPINRLEDFNLDKTPFIIYNNELEPKKFSMVASTYDLLPTIANLFDLDYDPRYYVGKDIFSEEEGIVIFANGSWITERAMYFATNGKTKVLGDELPPQYIKNTNEKVKNYMYVSEQVYRKNYFKYRFNK
ncbi:MAG: sulfatase-like hydrolase/transferase [Bacilli bacterium]|nr:sulfatase-like hydrolase/transferase [Bacilli bacterium]